MMLPVDTQVSLLGLVGAVVGQAAHREFVGGVLQVQLPVVFWHRSEKDPNLLKKPVKQAQVAVSDAVMVQFAPV